MAMEPNQGLCLPWMEVYTDPEVWAIGGNIGRAKNTQLVEISLIDQNLFLCQKQYLLRPKAQQGLIPIIRKHKRTEIIN